MRQLALYSLVALFFSLCVQTPAMSQDRARGPQKQRTVIAQVPIDRVQNDRPQLGVRGFATQSGYNITHVVPGSVAAKMGLERGDVIKRVNRSRPRSTQDLIRALDVAVGSYRGSLDMTVENIRWKTGRSTQRFVRVQGNLYDW